MFRKIHKVIKERVDFAKSVGVDLWAKQPAELVAVREVADKLKVSVRQVQLMALEGTLPGFRVGKQWRFRKVDIVEWIELQTQMEVRSPIQPTSIDVAYERALYPAGRR